jgi:phosphoribosyl 1,2-cyclic phosphodiesterase
MSISVRFWGTRGSIPVSGARTAAYGGNTACVELRCGGRRLIFDAGSGIRELGDEIMAEKATGDLDIFFSHVHLDHLIGLPFFAPMYDEKYRIRLWAGNLRPETDLKSAVGKLMNFPLFPTSIDTFSNIEFRDFIVGEMLKPSDGIVIRTAPLDHPGGAIGYRVEFDGHAVAYVTDTEIAAGKSYAGIVSLVHGADLMIIDATYTHAELPLHRGWGHSSWQECAQLADAASVRQLCLFHHDPSHDDAFMEGVAQAVAARRPYSIVARDGLTIEI